MTPILIGITGRKGVGKSTLATMLAELIPDAQIVAFADALKKHTHIVLEDLTGVALPPHRIEDLKADCLGPMYQGYGEFMRRMFGPDFWIKQLAAKLPERAIVADVRYPNEAEWILGNNGLLVAIDGPCRRAGDQRSTTHPSEAQVDACALLCHVDIVNTTLDQLREDAASIATRAIGAHGLAG